MGQGGEEGGSEGPSDLPWSPPLKVKEARAGVPTQMTTTRFHTQLQMQVTELV